MTQRPWMPLYVPDYLADTGHMSTVEHGAYLLLIMHYWQNGGLPDDDRKLARITRLTPDEWAEVRPTVAEHFHDGWKHKRVDAELETATKVMSKRSAAGKAGASARYGKRMANASDSHDNRMANAKQTDAPSPSPSPEDRKPPTNVGGKSRGTRLPPDFEPDIQAGMDAGLPYEAVIEEIPKFQDHFAAAPGQKGVRVDWPATWRNWCRTAAQWRKERNARSANRSPNPGSRPPSGADGLGHALAGIVQRERERGHGAPDHTGEQVVDDGSTPGGGARGPVLALVAGGTANG